MIPPSHADTKELTPKDFQIKEVILGKPTVDMVKILITMGLKNVFSHLDGDDSELIMLKNKNELLRGYLTKVVGPIDLDNLEISLGAILTKK